MSFNVTEIVVTHTYHYSPSEYVGYCEDNDKGPTLDGFIEYILPEINEDFPKSKFHPHRVLTTDSGDAMILDSEAIDAIAARMSGAEWNSDCASDVAEILRATGRIIAEPDGQQG